jgi:hypothetical protein
VNTDSIDTAHRRALWSVPWVLVHLGIVALTAVAVVVLARRGDTDVMRHVNVVAGAVGVVAVGSLVAIVALARHRGRVPRLLPAALTAMFASYVCSFLAALPGLAAVSGPLNVAHGVLTFVALPLAVGAAWQALRARRRDA